MKKLLFFLLFTHTRLRLVSWRFGELVTVKRLFFFLLVTQSLSHSVTCLAQTYTDHQLDSIVSKRVPSTLPTTSVTNAGLNPVLKTVLHNKINPVNGIIDYDSTEVYAPGRWVKYSGKLWQAGTDSIPIASFPGMSDLWTCLLCPDDPGGIDLSNYLQIPNISSELPLHFEDYDAGIFRRIDPASPSGGYLQIRIDTLRFPTKHYVDSVIATIGSGSGGHILKNNATTLTQRPTLQILSTLSDALRDSVATTSSILDLRKYIPTTGSNIMNGVFGLSNTSRIDAANTSGTMNIGTTNASLINVGKALSFMRFPETNRIEMLGSLLPPDDQLLIFGHLGFGEMGISMENGPTSNRLTPSGYSSSNTTTNHHLRFDLNNWLDLGRVGAKIVINPDSIVHQGVGANITTLNWTQPTTNRTITFQDGSGTVAFLSDITGGGGGTTTNPLTAGWGLTSSGTFNGAVARTFAADTSTNHLATQYYVNQALLSGSYITKIGQQNVNETGWSLATLNSGGSVDTDITSQFVLTRSAVDITNSNIDGPSGADYVDISLDSPSILFTTLDPAIQSAVQTTFQIMPTYLEIKSLDQVSGSAIQNGSFFGLRYFHQYLTYGSASAVTTYDHYVPDIKFVKDAVAGATGSGVTANALSVSTGLEYISGTSFDGSAARSIRLASGAAATNLGFTPIGNVLSSANFIVGNSSDLASAVTMSGHGSLSNTGVLTVSGVPESAITNLTTDLAAKQATLTASLLSALIHNQSYTATAGQTAFTLSSTVTTTLIVVVAGIVANAADYTATGTTLTLTTGASVGEIVQIIYL